MMFGISQWVLQIAGLITGITAIIAAARGIVKWSREQRLLVNQVLAEFSPNGGSSLRDSINRIEALQFTSLRMTGKAYWTSNADGEAEYISPALAAIMGGSQEQFTKNGWIGAVPISNRKAVVDDWNACVADQREFDCLYAYQHSDGTRVEVHGHAIPMTAKDKSGKMKVIGYLGWVEVLPNV